MIIQTPPNFQAFYSAINDLANMREQAQYATGSLFRWFIDTIKRIKDIARVLISIVVMIIPDKETPEIDRKEKTPVRMYDGASICTFKPSFKPFKA